MPVCVKKSNCCAVKMDLLIRRLFGRSSEKLDADQLELFLLAPENEPGKVDASSLEDADPRHERRVRHDGRSRERWPAELSVVEQIIDPEEVQKAPEAWRLIGGAGQRANSASAQAHKSLEI